MCCAAGLLGIIPCVLCIDGKVFAYMSVVVFLVSIMFHVYILIKWRQYADHSPVVYAIVQPCNHLIIMCFALAVGSTSMCNISAGKNEFNSIDGHIQEDLHMTEFIKKITKPESP